MQGIPASFASGCMRNCKICRRLLQNTAGKAQELKIVKKIVFGNKVPKSCLVWLYWNTFEKSVEYAKEKDCATFYKIHLQSLKE
jgi:hypothetical protein